MRCSPVAFAMTPMLVAVSVALLPSESAGAYTNAHCRQPSPKVFTRVGGSSSYVTASNAALSDWKATPTPITFTPATTYKLGIDVGGYGSSGYDGITYTYCGTGVQTSASNSYYNSYYTNAYTATAKRQVMVHEVGHALGLGHAGSASCSGQPIMYPSSSRYFTCHHVVPQTDDVNGINVIY